MTLDFLHAVALTLRFEGEAYQHDPADRGGESKYGLTRQFLAADPTLHDLSIRDLSLLRAITLYWELLWEPLRLGEFGAVRWPITAKVFDMAVWMGATQATRYLQRALNRTLAGFLPPLTEDGRLGDLTLAAVHQPAARVGAVMPVLIQLAIGHYQGIIERDPRQEQWRAGWSKRASYDPQRLRMP